MTTSTETAPHASPTATTLPPWREAVAVVAHPDDESFGLGAILDAFARAGTRVRVLCLTHGEASTVHGVAGDLAELRAAELLEAAQALGVERADLAAYPDGSLAEAADRALADVRAAARGADGLIVFDPSGVTGHPDHSAATDLALRVAAELDLPVLGWTLPAAVADRLNGELGTGFVGHRPEEIDLALEVDRDRQRIASLAHASQAIPTSVLWRRLELLGTTESLRWLRRPAQQNPSQEATPAASASSPKEKPVSTMTVDWKQDDQFSIAIRDHEVLVDQPEEIGGQDEAPTPTELFIASLASCVAFYARRYLRRHKLDATGLRVEADFTMAEKPARVGTVELRLQIPDSVPAERRDALLAVASNCTVHHSITQAPEISVTFAE